MTNYIVDTSVLIQMFVQEEYTAHVNAMFQSVEEPEHSNQFFIPDFCLLECINVLWKQARFHGLPQAEAEKMIEDLRNLPLLIIPSSTATMEAFRTGIRYNLAVYDSIYIALAKQLNYPLITVDQKQMQAATQEHVTVTALTRFVP